MNVHSPTSEINNPAPGQAFFERLASDSSNLHQILISVPTRLADILMRIARLRSVSVSLPKRENTRKTIISFVGLAILAQASDGQMDHGQVKKPRISREKPVRWPDMAFGHLTPQANFAPVSPQRSGLDPSRSRLDGSDAEENAVKPKAYATWL